MIDGQMNERPGSIGFWTFDAKAEAKNEPYIEAELQRGTTPLVKMMGDIHTRNFRNFHHPTITAQDFAGSLVVLLGKPVQTYRAKSKRGGEPVKKRTF